MCFGILIEEQAAQKMNVESSGLITNQIVQPQRIGLISECLCFPGLDTRLVHMPQSPSVRMKEMEPVLHERALSFRKAEMLHRYRCYYIT